LPTDLTQFIMSRRGQGTRTGQALVLQQNFTFRGTFTEGDKRWFLKASENMAYAAFEKVIKEAQRG